MKKLVIISHTTHLFDKAGKLVAWAPTVNEINYLALFFDEIVHVACLDNKESNTSFIEYSSSKIKYYPIPNFGGTNFIDKLNIIYKIPKILKTIRKALNNATHVQLRLPMSIGIFLLPYFRFRDREKYHFWVKYANNWIQNSPPLSYRFQRWFLKINFARCLVTINGRWPDQPSHCLTFENPCLKKLDRESGNNVIASKNINKPFKLVFVGNINKKKGLIKLLHTLKFFNSNQIESLEILGGGSDLEEAIEIASTLTIPVNFHGFVSTETVHSYLKTQHFLILPSESEGFPKVAAEALNYGCIPILSKVGSIPYYLTDHKDSILMAQNNIEYLKKTLDSLLETDHNTLKEIQISGYKIAEIFTHEAYVYKLFNNIFRENFYTSGEEMSDTVKNLNV
jgi:glycosyltransferase involved in cell wall biosynthesis